MMILNSIGGCKDRSRQYDPFVQVNNEENWKMGNLNNSSVDPNVLPECNKIPDGTQEPCEEIPRGNICEECIILNQGYGIDGNQELMLYGKISL